MRLEGGKGCDEGENHEESHGDSEGGCRIKVDNLIAVVFNTADAQPVAAGNNNARRHFSFDQVAESREARLADSTLALGNVGYVCCGSQLSAPSGIDIRKTAHVPHFNTPRESSIAQRDANSYGIAHRVVGHDSVVHNGGVLDHEVGDRRGIWVDNDATLVHELVAEGSVCSHEGGNGNEDNGSDHLNDLVDRCTGVRCDQERETQKNSIAHKERRY